MKCHICGSEVFYLDVDITLIVKGDTAYVDDDANEEYVSVKCAKCGEYGRFSGTQLLKGITTLKHNYKEIEQLLDKEE